MVEHRPESDAGHEERVVNSGHQHEAGHGGPAGHDRHGGHGNHAAMFRQRFWIVLVLALPVVLWAPMIQQWFGYSAPAFAGDSWLPLIAGSIIFWYGGWPFLRGGYDEARERQPGMMLLIAMAISVAYAASIAHELGRFDSALWWELALLIAIMLLGHWFEMRAIGQAQQALSALSALLPDSAELVDADGQVHRVDVNQLRVDNLVLVRPGGRIPADGIIVEGTADVDESMITGEAHPVVRAQGDRVVAGTVATDARLKVKVTATGSDTALASIERMVTDAQESRSRTQVLADRAAALLFYVAVAAGIATAIVWTLLGQPLLAVDRTVTVLVIACPHALGLAIPLVTSISTAKAARAGILVKDRLALELMRKVDVVLFDKTGTLTKGEHVVREVIAAHGVDTDDVLRWSAAVEAESEHPLGRAIRRYAEGRVAIPVASNFSSAAGVGVRARVGDSDVAVGGPALLRERGLAVPDELERSVVPWHDRGASILHVVRSGRIVAAIVLEDELRDASRRAVDELHAEGLAVAMITGDAQPVATAIAEALGIDEVFAEVLPADKAAKVAELQQRGLTVAMIGDGVNDAPALARADVGVAIGAGTDVAVESAGIVLAADDPAAIVVIRRLAAATYRKMIQNLWWAAGYNVAAIPLAAGILAGIGFVLPMAVGAALMSLSTIVVALNAQLLRRVDTT